MPVYEYVCSKCGHEFEELILSVSARDKVPCPQCGGRKVTRQLSVFAAPEAESPAPAGPAMGPCGGCGMAGGSCPMGG